MVKHLAIYDEKQNKTLNHKMIFLAWDTYPCVMHEHILKYMIEVPYLGARSIVENEYCIVK